MSLLKLKESQIYGLAAHAGVSNRPASYPGHKHFGLKIGTVSALVIVDTLGTASLLSATAKVIVEVHFRQHP